MRKRLQCLLLLMLAFPAISAQEAGLSLIAPPATEYNHEKSTTYSISSLHAKRFKKEETRSVQIYNVPLRLDSLYRSKRHLLQVIAIDGDTVVYRFPLKSTSADDDAPYRGHSTWRQVYDQYEGRYKDKYTLVHGPIWVTYSVDSINELRRALNDSVLVFTGGYDLAKEFFAHNASENLMREFKFTGISFNKTATISVMGNEYQLLSLACDGLSINIRPDSIYLGDDSGLRPLYVKDFSYDEIKQAFTPKSSYLKKRESLYDDDTLASFASTYTGKEVYLMSDATDWRTKRDIPRGYYSMGTLAFAKVPNLNDYYYTVTLTTHDKEFLFTLRPDDNYIAMFTTADSRRQYETERRRKEELKRLKQKQEEAEAEKMYKAELTRKFGSSNAKLIINGEVRLGFTKTMCEEAWGTPYDITRVTTQLGTTEAWWYGAGNVLYFQDERLVMIQN